MPCNCCRDSCKQHFIQLRPILTGSSLLQDSSQIPLSALRELLPVYQASLCVSSIILCCPLWAVKRDFKEWSFLCPVYIFCQREGGFWFEDSRDGNWNRYDLYIWCLEKKQIWLTLTAWSEENVLPVIPGSSFFTVIQDQVTRRAVVSKKKSCR